MARHLFEVTESSAGGILCAHASSDECVHSGRSLGKRTVQSEYLYVGTWQSSLLVTVLSGDQVCVLDALAEYYRLGAWQKFIKDQYHSPSQTT